MKAPSAALLGRFACAAYIRTPPCSPLSRLVCGLDEGFEEGELAVVLGEILRMPLHADDEVMMTEFDGLDDADRLASGDVETPAKAIDGLMVERVHARLRGVKDLVQARSTFDLDFFAREYGAKLRGFFIEGGNILMK